MGWLKKSSKEVLSRGGICMRFRDTQIGSRSRSRVTTPKWLIFSDQNLMHMLHVTTPPSMTFWAISRTPAYSIFVCLRKKTYYETACDSNVENGTIRFKFYGRLIMEFKEISREEQIGPNSLNNPSNRLHNFFLTQVVRTTGYKKWNDLFVLNWNQRVDWKFHNVLYNSIDIKRWLLDPNEMLKSWNLSYV